MLHYPYYAGAFAFGRTRTTKTADGKPHIVVLPRDEWQVLLRDAHVGYITWDDYEAHLAQLAANSQGYTPQRLNPPREGPALLQGLVVCGRCGERMTVRYHQRGGQRIVPDYVCQRAGIAQGMAPCQRIPGRDLDATIASLLLDLVTPEMIERTPAIHDELARRTADAARLRQLQVQRAQYEADLAQRRYLRVDPDNRLVADVLEAEWNAKLRSVAAAQEAADQQQVQDEQQLSAAERGMMVDLPRQFVRFWHDLHTPDRERKRITRVLIVDVTVTKTDEIVAQIRFKGGATQCLTIALPPPFLQSCLTAPATLAAIDQLLALRSESPNFGSVDVRVAEHVAPAQHLRPPARWMRAASTARRRLWGHHIGSVLGPQFAFTV